MVILTVLKLTSLELSDSESLSLGAHWLLCPLTKPAIFCLWRSSSSNQTLTLTFVLSLCDSSPTSHGCPYEATPSSSGPRRPTYRALSRTRTPPQTLTLTLIAPAPIFHKMTSLPSLTCSPTLAFPPVHRSRAHWTGPESSRVRVCYRLCSTTSIRLPNCFTRCFFGQKSGRGFDPLRRSSAA